MKSWFSGLCLSLAFAFPSYAQPDSSPAPATNPSPATEASPSAGVEEEADDVEFRGYASFGYTRNFRNPADGINQLRGYDFADNKVKLDVLELERHPLLWLHLFAIHPHRS